MLVLTRRIGEEIVINGNIRVTVVKVKGDQVRIGIEAPANVPVDRQEVHERRARLEGIRVTPPVSVPAPTLFASDR
jgi:carbon storage regulator